jgi:uncharacterized protein (DUF305 family)
MRRLRTVAALSLAGLTLAACGTAPVDAPRAEVVADKAAVAAYNDTDVMFLQMLVPHHREGIAISRLAQEPGRDLPDEIRNMAAAIESTQTAEVSTMAGWLRDWRQPESVPHSVHEAHGGQPSTSPAEIAATTAKSGLDFQRAYLNLLIAHQDDAIQLARMEVAGGVAMEAKELATRVVLSRSAQITEMLALLDHG